jgi:hypothetical protein
MTKNRFVNIDVVSFYSCAPISKIHLRLRRCVVTKFRKLEVAMGCPRSLFFLSENNIVYGRRLLKTNPTTTHVQTFSL